MDAIQSLIAGFEKRLAHKRKAPGLKSQELFYEVMIDYYRKIAGAREAGRPIAWLGIFSPIEIFHAMEIVPFVPELHALMATSQGNIQTFFDAAVAHGLPIEICSVHRAMTGMSEVNFLPPPDILINTSQVCDSGIKFFESQGIRYERPTFFLDQPYSRDAGALAYYQRELERLVSFLEETAGRKMDPARLREVTALSAEATRYYEEILELRKTVPTPMKGRDSFRNFTAFFHTIGTPGGVEFFRTVRDEVKAQVEQGLGAAQPEKHRLLWLYGSPSFGMNVFDWLEEEWGVGIVVDMFSYTDEEPLDPDRPIESLARKGFYEPLARSLAGGVEHAVEDVVRMAREYQADGAVFYALVTCKQGCAVIRRVRDALRERLGLPMLVIDADGIDPSILSADEIKTKLEEFLERLEE